MTESRWIEVNGVSLRYALSGQGDQLLVLVHEMGGSIESFDLIAEALGSAFRVLRYDQRNAGLSEKTMTPVTVDDLVTDLAALLERLQIEDPVTVCGAALGAAIAVAFAARMPEKTATLILMAPALGLADDRKAVAWARADQVEKEGVRPTADSRLMTSYPPRMRLDQARFDDVRLRRLSTDPRAISAYTRLLASLELAEDLPRVQCRTLVLAGHHDEDRKPGIVDRDTANIEDRRLEVLETGHFMALQTPRIVSDQILAFAAESCFTKWKASAS